MAAKAARPKPNRTLPWIIAGVAGLALVAVLAFGGPPQPRHPEPRPNPEDLAVAVMPASFFAGNPRPMRAYQMAREIPGTLDGMYCYCECREHLGHRSLLVCFNSQHGAGCDVCMGEAELAHQMIQQGRSLEDIRTATDLAYGN